MALTYYASIDFAKTPFTLTFTDAANSASIGTFTYSTGTFCVEAMTASGVSYSSYTTLASNLQTSLNASMSAGSRTWTCAWNTSTLAFTIDETSGTNFSIRGLGSALASNEVALGLLGLTTPLSGTATTNTSIQTSTSGGLYYIIAPTISGRSNVSDDYEPQAVSYDGEADDGTAYGISRTTAPTYHDWIQAMEPKAKTFIRSKASTVPWTYQHLVVHCRNTEPILVKDSEGASGTDDMIVRLRADGASWHPERVSADYDGQWNIPFRTRVIGRQ